MSMKCILIKMKIDIDINNDELLKTIWKHEEKKVLFYSIFSLSTLGLIQGPKDPLPISHAAGG
jgi:hypothetical protein